MTMRQILPCVLVLFVLATAGCDWNEEQPATPANKNTNVPTQSNANANTAAAQSTPNVNASRGNDVGDIENGKAAAGRSGQAAGKQPDNANARAASESSSPPEITANTPSQGLDQTRKDADLRSINTDQATGFPASPMDWVILGLVIAGGLLVLVLIGMGLLHLRNQSWSHLETYLGKAAAAQVSATRDAQKEILDKLSSLSSAQGEASGRLHDMHTEIRSLARMVRESSSDRRDGRSYAPLATTFAYNEPPPPKAEPDFPVSAVDYLGKMTRFANVVKPDFQNGILVSDPDGTGELMLIRDSRLPDETQPLFVVPRHAQFQTKQDFHTYYEKYYDCVRPSAGDVWIIDPAVVEKVSGGWQLREKGVLEIR